MNTLLQRPGPSLMQPLAATGQNNIRHYIGYSTRTFLDAFRARPRLGSIQVALHDSKDADRMSVALLSKENVISFVQTAHKLLDEAPRLAQWKKSQFLPETDGHWHLDLKEHDKFTRLRLLNPDSGRSVVLKGFHDHSWEISSGMRYQESTRGDTENARAFQSISIDAEGNLHAARYAMNVSGYLLCRIARSGDLFGAALETDCGRIATQIATVIAVSPSIVDEMEVTYSRGGYPRHARASFGDKAHIFVKTRYQDHQIEEMDIRLSPDDGCLDRDLYYRIWNQFRTFILHLINGRKI